jgi:hypothetical protein
MRERTAADGTVMGGHVQEDRAMRRKTTLFKSFTFAWWQLGLLKLSLLSLGIVVGATWSGVFMGWRDLLVVLFVAPAFYLSYVWLKQL